MVWWRIFTLWPMFVSLFFLVGLPNFSLHGSRRSPAGTVMLIGDLCVSLTISILFSRRLLSIESNTNNKKYTLLKRCLLLNIIAIISTQLTFVLIPTLGFASLWLSLDAAINSWCILLSFTEYNKIYWKVFGKLHNCIGHKCLLCYTCYCCGCYKIEGEISDSRSLRNRGTEKTITSSTTTNATNGSADNTEIAQSDKTEVTNTPPEHTSVGLVSNSANYLGTGRVQSNEVEITELTSVALDTKSMGTASSTNTLDLEIAKQQNKALQDQI